MVEHIVLFRLTATASDEQTAAFITGLESMSDSIEGITELHAGLDSSPEGKGHGFGLALLVRFVDAAARDRYLVDPYHREVVAAHRQLFDDVLVVDFAH